MYARDDDGREILIPLNMGREDMDIKKQWRFFGADIRQAEQESAAETEKRQGVPPV